MITIKLRFITVTFVSGVTEGCLGAQWRGAPSLGGPDKNDHKIFDSTLGKLVQTSVIEGQKIFNGPPPKAGIGKIVKSGLFSRYGMQTIFADSFLHVIVI
jgi:hypothetical protein